MTLGEREAQCGFASAVAAARAAIATERVPEARLLAAARWIGASGSTWWWTEQPIEHAAHADGLWCSEAAGRLAANTRVCEGDAWWAQVLLPLPEGTAGVRLLVHEAWHAFGQVDSFSHRSVPEMPGDGSLESPEGRALMGCERAALVAALRTDPKAWSDAERLRLERLARGNDAERRRQLWLEGHEGAAESMAWEITGGTDEELAAGLARDLERDRNLTRTFAYLTEPARRRLKQRAPVPPVAGEPLDLVLSRYGYSERLTVEDNRRAEQQHNKRERADAFNGPVLRLRLDPPEVVFDPGQTEPHPLGTWYGQLRWRHHSGSELEVHQGCVIDPQWTSVLLSQPTIGTDVTGPGWTLTLRGDATLDNLTF